jgi:hypothetical protein
MGKTGVRKRSSRMAKPPRETLQRVVEKKMPGYKIIPKKSTDASRDSSRPPRSDTPDIEALRRKYLRRTVRPGDKDQKAADHPTRDTRSAKNVAIVAVEPKDRTRDGQLPGGHRAKRVVIAEDTDEIIGEQG